MAKTERVLPELLEIPFVICDNTLNRRGWRLLVEGIETSGFLKNPVCCVQHDTWGVPVGKWKGLRVENGQLTGTVEFDRNDEAAVKLFWKYKDGYMSAVSIHVIPLAESDELALLLPGQRYPTITKSELLEISLVTVPGQKNAVKLYTPEGVEHKLNLISKSNPKTMDEVKAGQSEAASAELAALQAQLAAQKQLNAKNLVQLHVVRGAVQAAEVEHLTKLAEGDYETVEKMLDARAVEPPAPAPAADAQAKKLAEDVKRFAQGAGGGGNAKAEREGWGFLDWFKRDPEGLALMAKEQPDRLKALEDAFLAEAKRDNLIAS